MINLVFLKKSYDLNMNLTILITKEELKAKQDKIVRLQAFDSSHLFIKFILKIMACKSLLFQPVHIASPTRYLEKVANTKKVAARKSKGLPEDNITPPSASVS